MKQIIKAKVVYFSLLKHHIFFALSFNWKFNFRIFPPKVCKRVYIFPPNICRILCPELLTIFPRFCEYHERCTLLMLKSTATWEPKRLYLDLLACKEISKKLKKSERCVVKWSSRNDGFRDKKRTGRPKILNEAAQKKFWTKLSTKGKTPPDSFHNN